MEKTRQLRRNSGYSQRAVQTPALPPAMSPTGDPLTAAELGPAFMILLPLHFT